MPREIPSSVALYARIARQSFGRYATYRMATVGGAVANTLVALLKASVLIAVISQRGSIGGFDASDLVTFAFVSMALDQPVAIFAPLELIQRIRSGDVVVDMYRPTDIQLYWLAHELGRCAFNCLTRLAPPILFGGLFFHLRLPASPAIWLASAASVGAAILVSFGIRFAIALSGFWLLEGQGVQGIVGLLIVVSSGWMVPLVLFPPGVAAVARNLPFAALAQLPIEVFLGKQHGWDFVTVLGRQLAWAVAFILGGRLLLSRATRRLVVQGG